MSIKRGVVTQITSTSARPISVTSTLPIALVLKKCSAKWYLRIFKS